jgi:hypothetical protein
MGVPGKGGEKYRPLSPPVIKPAVILALTLILFHATVENSGSATDLMQLSLFKSLLFLNGSNRSSMSTNTVTHLQLAPPARASESGYRVNLVAKEPWYETHSSFLARIIFVGLG